MTSGFDATAREQRLDQAIASFLAAQANGQAADPKRWREMYPDLATELAEFFSDFQQIQNRLALTREEPSNEALPPVAGSDSLPDTTVLNTTVPKLSADRYRLLNFHARGGMGEVWVAEDTQIGRQVALKKLRSERVSLEPRFLLEAQLTGQLEHPCIVPLHDLGVDQDGKPFYVMKFIQGQSLKDVIAEHHHIPDQVDAPRELRIRRLLETFVSVCRALAYAHSKGVLHRDIKPENIMLGLYGETLLVDWGLAKAIGGEEPPCGEMSLRLKSGYSTDTQEGSILGSPAYMAPESALGRADAVDQQTDVYLLGSTLYEILTGRPPRSGSSQMELLDLVRTSPPVPPRKFDPRIPRTLEAICLKATAYRKQDRYDSPAAVAEDVERYLADEPTSAYREPVRTRAWRWARRHRRSLARVASGAVALLLVAIALSQYHQAAQLARREEFRGELTQFHRLADEAQFFAANTDAIWERVPYFDPGRALSSARSALKLTETWGPNLRDTPLVAEAATADAECQRLRQLLVRLSLQKPVDQKSLRESLMLLDQAAAKQELSQGLCRLRAAVLRKLGDDAGSLAMEEQARDPRTPATAEDHFQLGELFRLNQVVRAADVHPESALRDENLKRAVEEYRRTLNRDPRHYWAHFQLGRCYLGLGRHNEAVETLGACIALRPDTPWAYSVRGLALGLQEQFTQSRADLDKALQLDPQFLPARLNRGVIAWLENRPNEAMADFDFVLGVSVENRLIEAAFYRAQIHLEKQGYARALTDLNRVVAEAPDFRPVYELRSRVQFLLGSDAAGWADLNFYLALATTGSFDPDSSTALQTRSRIVRTWATALPSATAARIFGQARQELQMAVTRDPVNVALYAELGALEELVGQPKAAIDAYSRVLVSSPESVQVRNQRGWAYVSLKKDELALEDFRAALGHEPQNGVLLDF